jgi:hypothetical protein
LAPSRHQNVAHLNVADLTRLTYRALPPEPKLGLETPVLLGRFQRNHRIFVTAVAHPAFGEDAAPCDPVEGLGVSFLGLGLEDQALAEAPAAGVHLRVEALGEFVVVVMRVAVGAQVEVALRAA